MYDLQCMTNNTLTIPNDLPGRLRVAGTTLYGSSWRSRLAAGLGVSRSTLFEWCRGGKAVVDIDAAIIDLIDRERDEASLRGIQLTALKNRFVSRRSS